MIRRHPHRSDFVSSFLVFAAFSVETWLSGSLYCQNMRSSVIWRYQCAHSHFHSNLPHLGGFFFLWTFSGLNLHESNVAFLSCTHIFFLFLYVPDEPQGSGTFSKMGFSGYLSNTHKNLYWNFLFNVRVILMVSNAHAHYCWSVSGMMKVSSSMRVWWLAGWTYIHTYRQTDWLQTDKTCRCQY